MCQCRALGGGCSAMPKRRAEREPDTAPLGDRRRVRINMAAYEQQLADEKAWRQYLRSLDTARWGLYGPIDDEE